MNFKIFSRFSRNIFVFWFFRNNILREPSLRTLPHFLKLFPWSEKCSKKVFWAKTIFFELIFTENCQFSNRNRFLQKRVILMAKLTEKDLFHCKNRRFWAKIKVIFDDAIDIQFRIPQSPREINRSGRWCLSLISHIQKWQKNDSKTQNSNQSLDKIEFIFKALKIHSQIEHVSS